MARASPALGQNFHIHVLFFSFLLHREEVPCMGSESLKRSPEVGMYFRDKEHIM